MTDLEARRRVVVIRRLLTGEVMMSAEDNGITVDEYAVLVPNTDYEILSLGQCEYVSKLWRQAPARLAQDHLRKRQPTFRRCRARKPSAGGKGR